MGGNRGGTEFSVHALYQHEQQTTVEKQRYPSQLSTTPAWGDRIVKDRLVKDNTNDSGISPDHCTNTSSGSIKSLIDTVMSSPESGMSQESNPVPGISDDCSLQCSSPEGNPLLLESTVECHQNHQARQEGQMTDQPQPSTSSQQENEVPTTIYKCTICKCTKIDRSAFIEHLLAHSSSSNSIAPNFQNVQKCIVEELKHLRIIHYNTIALQRRGAENIESIEATEDDDHENDSLRINSQGRIKLFRCKHCRYVAITKNEYWRHSRIHMRCDRILDCDMSMRCFFVTEFKHHMEYHFRNHVGAKPFQCEKCVYVCVNKSMLNSHMKSHSDLYDYRCADCEYATKYCHSMKMHLRNKHHQPALVYDEHGNPIPIFIDVYGTKRGPRKKKNSSKEARRKNARLKISKANLKRHNIAVKIKKNIQCTKFSIDSVDLSLSQPSTSGFQPLMSQSQPSISQSQPSISLSQPSVSLPQPVVPIPQPELPLSQPSTPLPQSTAPLLQPAVPTPQAAAPLFQPPLIIPTLAASLFENNENVADKRDVNQNQPMMTLEQIFNLFNLNQLIHRENGMIQNDSNHEEVHSAMDQDEEIYENVSYSRVPIIDDTQVKPPINLCYKQNSPKISPMSIEPSSSQLLVPHLLPSQTMTPQQPTSQSRTEEDKKMILKFITMPIDLRKTESTNQIQEAMQESSISKVKGASKRKRKGKAIKLQHRIMQEDTDSEETGQVEKCCGPLASASISSTRIQSQNVPNVVKTENNSESVENSQDSQRITENPRIAESIQNLQNAQNPVNSQGSQNQRSNSNVKEYYDRFCEITFRNEVMYLVHMGYHGFNEPFTCNVCGYKCHDNITFFLHINRSGHSFNSHYHMQHH